MTAAALRELSITLFGSTLTRVGELVLWDERIRRTTAATQRIGFVSLQPGAGTTTLATAVTRVLAARRAEPVLAVDVSGSGSFGRRLGIQPTPPNAVRSSARTTAEAIDGLHPGSGWFGARPTTDSTAVEAWLDEVAPICRFFDVCVTDFGTRSPHADLAACAALSDVVCLVSSADRRDAEIARAIAPAIEDLPESPTAALALVDHDGGGAAVSRAFGTDRWPVIGIPCDAGLRAGRVAHTPDARRAVLRLAATLVGEVPS